MKESNLNYCPTSLRKEIEQFCAVKMKNNVLSNILSEFSVNILQSVNEQFNREN